MYSKNPNFTHLAIKEHFFDILYINILTQEWQLVVSEGKKVELTFLDFSIEPDPICQYDYLEISYDSFNQRYCGETIQQSPGQITSTGIFSVTLHMTPRN